jgi:hypothetical protein
MKVAAKRVPFAPSVTIDPASRWPRLKILKVHAR